MHGQRAKLLLRKQVESISTELVCKQLQIRVKRRQRVWVNVMADAEVQKERARLAPAAHHLLGTDPQLPRCNLLTDMTPRSPDTIEIT